MVVGMDEGLVGQTERGIAVRAGRQCRNDGAVGMFRERAGDAGSAMARLFGAVRHIVLLTFGGRQAGVVRRLGRSVEPGLQLGDASAQGLDLRGQLLDEVVLRQDQGNQVILGEGEKGFTIHKYGESKPPLPCQPEI